ARLAGCSDSPRLDAQLLLGKILRCDRATLVACAARPVADADTAAFLALLRARCDGTPVAYLTGVREFWSLPLTVSPAVLVPRPETEVLVEAVLDHLPPEAARRVLDLGTGSGAIALAIASERARAEITATDVSAEALAIARANASVLGFDRIRWRRGSWYEAVPGERFDLIVSNPPYVAAADPALAHLTAEPLEALTPGPTGLEALERIVADAARHLSAGGLLAIEHGADQGAAVAAELAGHRFRDVRLLRDGAGLPRVSLAYLSDDSRG
ncbi:MAG TPA: peptide chain release factor N(5)-glutamine methyltransferase, partial [Steroidobacteraceae bacterium]|nr:peptide chain release factor N(5)-glutamine methyltransferase [Steroidobacteraceae bacterium]